MWVVHHRRGGDGGGVEQPGHATHGVSPRNTATTATSNSNSSLASPGTGKGDGTGLGEDGGTACRPAQKRQLPHVTSTELTEPDRCEARTMQSHPTSVALTCAVWRGSEGDWAPWVPGCQQP